MLYYPFFSCLIILWRCQVLFSSFIFVPCKRNSKVLVSPCDMSKLAIIYWCCDTLQSHLYTVIRVTLKFKFKFILFLKNIKISKKDTIDIIDYTRSHSRNTEKLKSGSWVMYNITRFTWCGVIALSMAVRNA